MRLGLPATLRRAVPVELIVITPIWLLLCPLADDLSWTAAALEAIALTATAVALVYFRRMGSRPLEIGWRIILFARLLSLLGVVTDVSPLPLGLMERLDSASWAVGVLGLLWGLRLDRVRRATDIERLKRAISDRRYAHRRFVDLVDTVDGVVWEATTAPFQFHFVSRRAGPILGFAPQIWMQQPNLWSERIHPEDRANVLRQIDAAAEEGGYQLEYRMLSAEGQTIWVRDLVNVVRDADGTTRLRGVTVDVTETKLLEQRLRHSANHDALTGLPNRAAFREALERTFRNAAPAGNFAVLFLDLDRFKVINDTLGHLAGDAVLKEAAARIQRAVRSRDVVARLGGDEFAVLAEKLSSPEEARELAARLRSELNRPVQVGGRKFALSASVGIKLAGAGEAPKDVLRDADTAMYCAKENARGSQQVFQDVMHQRLVENVQTENDIRAALEAHQLSVRFQPIMRLDQDAVAGIEAVLVWEAPDGRLWLPEHYAQVAANSGLSVQLGWSAVREGLLAANRLDRPAPFLFLPLAAQLLAQTDFLEQFDQEVRETAADPRRVVLATTEGAASRAEALPLLNDLRARGFRIGLCNFGAGGASLSELCRTPVEVARIESSYLEGAASSRAETSLLQAMIRLCGELEVQLISGGVRTEEHKRLLLRLGCTLGQGPLFGVARQAREIERAWLESSAANQRQP